MFVMKPIHMGSMHYVMVCGLQGRIALQWEEFFFIEFGIGSASQGRLAFL
jgi:hypothetical protein